MDIADLAHLESEIWLQSALAAARSKAEGRHCGTDCCNDCGNRIPVRRRRSLPHTRLCIGCAEARERIERVGAQVRLA